MNTLVPALIKIKEHLSNKDRWEENHRNNKVTGYGSGSLANDLGGLYCNGQKLDYRVAYECCAKAIRDVRDVDIVNYKRHIGFPDGMENLPNIDDVKTVNAFNEFDSHEDLMKVLDLAIRYAKVYIFS